MPETESYHSNRLLNKIISHYLLSRDFNGISHQELTQQEIKELENFVDSGEILVLSEDECNNPFIKGYNFNIPVEVQKQYLSNYDKCVAIYPTAQLLKTIKLPQELGPYTLQLSQGEPQFKWVYFHPKILQTYFDDSRFLVFDHGYIGKISPKDELYAEDLDAEFVKNYGLARKKDNYFHRALCVLLYDLASLAPHKQYIWKGFEVSNQDDYVPNPDCVRNLLMDEFCEHFWGFDALLLTISYINKLCTAIGIPKMFRTEFCNEYDEIERPDGFHMLWLPTTKNYYVFLETLEKIVINNLTIEAFITNAPCVNSVTREKNEKTLALLEKWLIANVRASNKKALVKEFLKPLRQLREDRQTPAHKLYKHEYDEALWQKQIEVMKNILSVLMDVMLLLASHPKGKTIAIPTRLVENGNISSKILFC